MQMIKYWLLLYAVTQCCSGLQNIQNFDEPYISGDLTDIYSFMATIHVRGKHKCAGVLILAGAVITSVTCIDNAIPEEVMVYMGTTYATSPQMGVVRKVHAISKHESYRPDTLSFNLALLALESRGRLAFYKNCKSCKKVASNLFVTNIAKARIEKQRRCEDKCFVVGWSTDGNAKHIWKTSVTPPRDKDCNFKNPKDSNFDIIVQPSQELCRLDAGTAIFCNSHLVGIITRIPSCGGNKEVLFSEITKSIVWIKEWTKKFLSTAAPLHSMLFNVICLTVAMMLV